VEVLSHPGTRPQLIGATLSDRATVALAEASSGSLAIVDSNGGREIGSGKQVETCDSATRTCTPISGAATWSAPDPQRCGTPCFPHPPAGVPGSGVTLDPAWSPDGTLLAYVKAPMALTGGWPSSVWHATHNLMVWNPRTRASRRIARVSGASVPTWSRDGKDLLYVKDNSLWLSPVAGGLPVEIASPLYSAAEWRSLDHPSVNSLGIGYYGQIYWTSQFNWWSP